MTQLLNHYLFMCNPVHQDRKHYLHNSLPDGSTVVVADSPFFSAANGIDKIHVTRSYSEFSQTTELREITSQAGVENVKIFVAMARV